MTHFINASGETIPPFACMQICIPPNRWEAIKKLPLTEGAKQVMINLGTVGANQLPRYDQDTTIYCIKPNRMSALFQEPTTVAFNGPSFVPPNKQGVCTIGEYPTKAIGSMAHFPGTAMGIVAGSWRMNLLAAEAGAFRSLYPTTHQVSEQRKDVVKEPDDAEGYVRYVAPNTFRKSRLPLRTTGLISFNPGINTLIGRSGYNDFVTTLDAEDSPIFSGLGIPITSPFQADESFWFDSGRLDAPGYYRLRIKGALTGIADTDEFTSLPINLSVKFEYDKDRTGTFDTELGAGDLSTSLPRYVVGRVPTTQFDWPIMYFEQTHYITFRGQSGRIVLENKSSPFVVIPSDTPALKFELTRMTFSQIQTQKDLEWGIDILEGGVILGDPVFYVNFFTDAKFRSRIIFYPQSNRPPA